MCGSSAAKHTLGLKMTDNDIREPSSGDPAMTREAEELLDQSVAEFRSSLIEIARKEQASRVTSSKEITLQEIISALDQIGFAINQEAAASQVRINRHRFQRTAIAISAAALAVLVLAATVLIAVNRGFSEADQLASSLGILVSLAATATAIFSVRAATSSYRAREKASNAVELAALSGMQAQLIFGWAHLEKMLLDRYGSQSKDSRRYIGVGQLIQTYSKQASLSEQEVAELREILQMRNNVAHGFRGRVDRAELERIISLIRLHISRLEGR
ncbi:hypothetical protein HS041_03300 [Planomonospora sp. ID67723]|uniref:hypothetical protein n=1 Tax=Planomonospora sp. ID67723 TaxID=2738134 RepID=UPI0018C35E4E|nr:hypothetical protein [Planomonospora sp. ID67723]MBG0826801.1 hypothetical protein [Planomonospora sp. ID67723]